MEVREGSKTSKPANLLRGHSARPGIAGVNGDSGLVALPPFPCVYVIAPVPGFLCSLSTFP